MAPETVQSRLPSDPDFAIYVAYEQAFPLPDAICALACLVGVIGSWRMRDWGFFSMLLGVGGALFLGLEDLLYDLEHSMFVPLTGAAAVELAIVLTVLSFNSVSSVLLWTQRWGFFRFGG